MKYKVTLYWKNSHQAEVVEADSQESARALVLSGYDWGIAHRPESVSIEATDEPVGLQRYVYPRKLRTRNDDTPGCRKNVWFPGISKEDARAMWKRLTELSQSLGCNTPTQMLIAIDKGALQVKRTS